VALGIYAVVGGASSLAGWAFDIPRLTDWSGSGISIQPNSAVAAMSGGAGLVLLALGYRYAAAVLGLFVAAIGGSVVYQYFSGQDLNIDTLLMFGRQWGGFGTTFPGRMGAPGAVSWTLIGTALVAASVFRVRGSRIRAVVPAMAWVTIGISSLSLIGYLYGAVTLYQIPAATAIAFQTSTFVLTVSLGLMLSIPEHGAMRMLTNPGPAGVLVRRILPALIGLPVILGLIRLEGERAGFYDLAFGTAARTLIEIVLLLMLLWWTALAIRRQTEQRTLAEDALRDSKKQLQIDLADSQLLQRVSAEITREGDVQSLYDTIIDAAMTIMQSQFALMQIFDVERCELRLLNVRGFDDDATELWTSVMAESTSASGRALRTGKRVLVPDVLECQFIGTADRKTFSRLGIRALEATPLYSRTGELLGMISNHWTEPHEPSERAERLLEVLARQAADLIERKRSEDALLHADRRKDEFLMTLAHELRNPLAPIRSAVDLMKHAPSSATGEISWARDVLDRQTSLMARLLDDLLDVGRIARDTLELRTSRVDIRSIIRDAVDMNRSLVDEFSHELTVSVPNEPIYLDADPARLSQIVSNLLNNACRYTPSGGRIWLTAERSGNTAVVRVRDSGIGIPPDRLSNIFDMFSQVDRSLERSQRGLGIGLHLVKRLVEMHGGSVSAQSAGIGTGSEIIVRLPLVVEAPQPETISPLTSTAPSPVVKRRVLVVDDNVDGAESLAMLLDVCGHETHVAHDGVAAIEAADAVRPDVILLDIGLPKLNGFDVCQRIRQQPWGQNVIIIALTGWGQDVDRRRSHEAGFDHHVVKPVEHNALVELLRSEQRGGESAAGA
jgi:signal transduction histidine kinase/ActR/RegA family two-component response regulator